MQRRIFWMEDRLFYLLCASYILVHTSRFLTIVIRNLMTFYEGLNVGHFMSLNTIEMRLTMMKENLFLD